MSNLIASNYKVEIPYGQYNKNSNWYRATIIEHPNEKNKGWKVQCDIDPPMSHLVSKIIRYSEENNNIEGKTIHITENCSTFYNPHLQVNNVIQLDIDISIIEELYERYLLLKRKDFTIRGEIDDSNFYIKSPQWKSNILWISANNKKTYDYFNSILKKINIDILKKIIDIEDDIICNLAFFVTRSKCQDANFHTDYTGTKLNAFTIMIPLTNMKDIKYGHLLYKNKNGIIDVIRYERGKAIIFGDDFIHSTEPFNSKDDKEIVFACFAVGSDKEKYWKSIFNNVKAQTKKIIKYNGELVINTNEMRQLKEEN